MSIIFMEDDGQIDGAFPGTVRATGNKQKVKNIISTDF